MRLVSAITAAGGSHNEDEFGVVEQEGMVVAAWVLDGVTGINPAPALKAKSDAAWLVEKANAHLKKLAAQSLPLAEILALLVKALESDWKLAAQSLVLTPDYDPPAACLTLVKRYAGGWSLLRLGDSPLLAAYPDGSVTAYCSNNEFDHWLVSAAQQRHAETGWDMARVRASFTADLKQRRNTRNKPGGYSILEADQASLKQMDIIPLGWPDNILLCTDGFYRAVDHYQLYDNQALLVAAENTEQVLNNIRQAEAQDPRGESFPRFKMADDATAVFLATA